MQKLIKIRPKIIKYFFYPKIAVYCNKLFKIILGNILQFTIILVVKIILENLWYKMNENFWRVLQGFVVVISVIYTERG